MTFTLTQNAFADKKLKDGSMMSMSKLPFANTVSALTGAIEDSNLMVIKVVDAQKMLRMAGKKTKGMKQIFFFHPKFMKRVMEANKMATIQIPLKLIVMEKPDGKTVIRYFMPSTLLNKYKGEEKISAELDKILQGILAKVSK
tara:strand:- start:544 stop:972 length:429 start_codon:yes stop_codon:yes gene_type:complete